MRRAGRGGEREQYMYSKKNGTRRRAHATCSSCASSSAASDACACSSSSSASAARCSAALRGRSRRGARRAGSVALPSLRGLPPAPSPSGPSQLPSSPNATPALGRPALWLDTLAKKPSSTFYYYYHFPFSTSVSSTSESTGSTSVLHCCRQLTVGLLSRHGARHCEREATAAGMPPHTRRPIKVEKC